MIVILDYGMGNVGSILNMLRKAGSEAVVSSTPSVIKGATKLILPGVGAFDIAMSRLRERGLVHLLNERALEDRIPLLGICLGAQLFCRTSEEGVGEGFGWVDADVRRFRFANEDRPLKVPHMGWNRVHPRSSEGLFAGLTESSRFYFSHSYHVVCHEESDVLGTFEYGGQFVAAVQKGNILGVQFHPEKSHLYGLRILANFAEL